MKQKKQADKKSAPKKQAKPKLVKKPKENVYTDETIDVYMADLPIGVTRRLYWNMAMTNLKSWIKTFF